MCIKKKNDLNRQNNDPKIKNVKNSKKFRIKIVQLNSLFTIIQYLC